MSYKNEFVGMVKEYFQDSVVSAEALNVVWEEIEDYFEGIGKSLNAEINLLGNNVVYNHDRNKIGFSIRGVGLSFEKREFDIEVKQIQIKSEKNWKRLVYKDGSVVDEDTHTPYNEETLNVWLQGIYGYVLT